MGPAESGEGEGERCQAQRVASTTLSAPPADRFHIYSSEARRLAGCLCHPLLASAEAGTTRCGVTWRPGFDDDERCTESESAGDEVPAVEGGPRCQETQGRESSLGCAGSLCENGESVVGPTHKYSRRVTHDTSGR